MTRFIPTDDNEDFEADFRQSAAELDRLIAEEDIAELEAQEQTKLTMAVFDTFQRWLRVDALPPKRPPAPSVRKGLGYLTKKGTMT